MSNIKRKEAVQPNEFRIVFASAFVSSKGLIELVEGCNKLVEKGYKLSLLAVGEGLPFRNEKPEYLQIIKNLASQFDWFNTSSFVSKDKLVEIFSESDIFAMPSKPETFGLVYVEALTQCLPILYTYGEGFHGYFNEGEVGFAAKAFDPLDVADKLEKIFKNYKEIVSFIDGLDLREKFGWENISIKCIDLYKKWERKK